MVRWIYSTNNTEYHFPDQLKHFQPNERSVSGLVKHADCFIPFPAAHVSNITCFFDAASITDFLRTLPDIDRYLLDHLLTLS